MLLLFVKDSRCLCPLGERLNLAYRDGATNSAPLPLTKYL